MFPNLQNPNVDRKLRTGKYCAQAGHAYLESALKAQAMDTPAWDIYRSTPGTAKVCLYVKTQQDLLKVWKDIEASGLPCALIKDSGLTEFGGVETYTAIGIGPAFSDELRPLTEGLSLF